jgi:hypothetical protein
MLEFLGSAVRPNKKYFTLNVFGGMQLNGVVISGVFVRLFLVCFS